MVKILLATRNPGKRAEYRRLWPEAEWLLPEEFGAWRPPEEGDDYEENARGKARSLLPLARGSAVDLLLGEDSGLEVEALGGAPGARSARYGATAEEARRRLLKEMQGVRNRRARFRAVIVVIRMPEEEEIVVEGICEGWIAEEERGEGGFGYDPLFVPEGERRTFGEMAPEEKDRYSHRARALRALRERLTGGR